MHDLERAALAETNGSPSSAPAYRDDFERRKAETKAELESEHGGGITAI